MSAALPSMDRGGGHPAESGMFTPTRSWMAFAVLQAAAVCSWIAQLVMDDRSDNAYSATIILLASTVTFQFLRLTRSFVRQPFSSLAVLGLCMTTQWGALVAQSCAWTPVADNLRTPVKTFGLLGCYQMMAIVALWLSARLGVSQRFQRQFGQRILAPLGIFETPSAPVVWCLGGIGFVAIVAGGLLQGGGGIVGKLIDGFRSLAWAPFIIPVLARRTPNYGNARTQTLGLVGYTLMVIGLGMAVNARTIMFVGIMTVGLLAFLLTLGSDDKVRPSQLWKLVPAMLLATAGLGYASDLALATVIVRDQRNSAGPLKMIELTVETLFDAPLLETFKGGIDNYSKVALYDEYYISNQVLTRLIETKFHDNMFFLSSNLQPAELASVKRHTVQIMLATLPDPVLKFLDIPIDKAALIFSVGDFFDYLRYGNDLGSFKIGSIFAHGQALFGQWFFLIYMVMCGVVFTVWDSFVRWQADGSAIYAPIALLSVFGIFFNTISGDSIMVVIGFLTRGTVQALAVYAAAFAFAKLLFPKKPNDLPISVTPSLR